MKIIITSDAFTDIKIKNGLKEVSTFIVLIKIA